MSDLIAAMPTSTNEMASSSSAVAAAATTAAASATVSNNNQEDKKDTILKLFQYDLERHRMREVLEMFKRAVVPEVRKNGSYIIWDLVPIICQRLRGLSEFRFKTFNLCRQILLELCEICNPKELLIIYLSELENDLNITRYDKRDGSNAAGGAGAATNNATKDEENPDVTEEEITDSNCFKALLKPFEVILLKLPKKRNETLKSILSSLNEHISRLSLSSISKFDLENGDRAKLMNDPVVKNINTVLSMYVDFLATFVKEVDLYNNNAQSQNHSKTSDPNIQRVILLKTLLLILDYPIKYMDLYHTKEIAPDAAKNGAVVANPNLSDLFNEDLVTTRLIAIKIVQMISCLHSNFYTLMNRTDLIDEDNETGQDYSDVTLTSSSFHSAISVLCYLLATEPTLSPSNFMPRVYTHIYNFGIHLPYVPSLLESSLFFMYDKGLRLLSALLDHIKSESLEVKFLDLLRQHPIEKSLISIMVFSSDKTARQTALTLFKRLVNCFEPVGRYKILYSIISEPRLHPGFQGVVVNLYKDLLFSHPIFQGTNLHRMVRSMILVSLPQEADSDLLEKNDLIFGALNFLRYILMRDRKKENVTRIWDLIGVIQENFLKPLQDALDLSRAHFKLELCKLTELKMKMNKGDKSGKGKKKGVKVELNVLNETGDRNHTLTIEQEHKSIMLALQNFDLLESILVRVREIIDEHHQQP